MSYDVEADKRGVGLRRWFLLLQLLEFVLALTAMMLGLVLRIEDTGVASQGYHLAWIATLIGGITIVVVPIEAYFEWCEPDNKYIAWILIGPDVLFFFLWAVVPPVSTASLPLIVLSILEAICFLANFSTRGHRIRVAEDLKRRRSSVAQIGMPDEIGQRWKEKGVRVDDLPPQPPPRCSTPTPYQQEDRSTHIPGHRLRQYSVDALQNHRPAQSQEEPESSWNQSQESLASVDSTANHEGQAHKETGHGGVDGAEEVELGVIRTSKPPVFSNGIHPLHMNPYRARKPSTLRSVQSAEDIGGHGLG